MSHANIPHNPNSPLSPSVQDVITKEVMKKLVEQGLAGPEPFNGQNIPTVEPPRIQKAAEEKPVSTTKKLDEDERLRVDNLVLREQNEEMRRELALRDIGRARLDLQNYLHEKHNIDTDSYKIIVDASEKTLTIEPK